MKNTRRENRRKMTARGRFFMKCAILTAVFLILFLGVFSILPQHGNQMYPAVRDGDLAVAVRFSKGNHLNAVIVYRAADGSKRIGRVTGLAGDVISFTQKGSVKVNGLRMPEENAFLEEEPGEDGIRFPLTVPKDSVFVLNDHRIEKEDSRMYGCIDYQDVCGEVIWLFRRRGF